MDGNLTVRASGLTPVAPVKTESTQARQAAAPELRNDQTVTRAEETVAVNKQQSAQNKASQKTETQARPETPALDRQIELDPETNAMVLKLTNPKTGMVVSQYPNEAQLKLRAYVRTLADEASSKEKPTTNREV